MRGDLQAMQKGIPRSRVPRRSGPADKKKNTMMCLAFILLLVIAITIVVVVNLD